MVQGVLQTILFGLQIGFSLMLIAIGLTLILGMMDVMNVAHGSFFMLGGFAGATISTVTGNFWLGLLLVPVLVGIAGLISEILLLRPIYGRDPIYHLLLTLGILFVIQNLIRLTWGSQFRSIDVPDVLAQSVSVLGMTYPFYRIFVLFAGAIVTLSLWLFLKYTSMGLIIRASSHDPTIIQALGIDVYKIYSLVFFVGTALAAFAGYLLGAQTVVHHQMDVEIIILAFAIIVIGGLKSIKGAIIGSLLVGMLIAFGGIVIPAYTDMIVFVLMLIVLILKPTGLFGQKVAK